MTCIDRVSLIDRDAYEKSNLLSQDITPADVSKPKALVQARRLRRINPALCVDAIVGAVERVPLARLRGDLILACLDSRIARQHVSQFAWRLGVPMIDAGVEPGGLLARVNVYVPGPDSPCLECAWDDRDYAALEQTYPCQGAAATVAATNGPSSLGALAAALQAIECGKLLTGAVDRMAAGSQVLIDASHHKQYVTSFRRNANCRFPGHDVWDIRMLNCSPAGFTLNQALKLGPSAASDPVSFTLEGKPFVTRLSCVGCGGARSLLRLECSLNDKEKTCARCGKRMVSGGFDFLERLTAACLSRSELARSVRRLGLRQGDVFSVGDDERKLHYQIAWNDASGLKEFTMNATEALGVDIGGVIISKAGGEADTSFSSRDYLNTPAVARAFEVIRRLVDERFGDRLFLVSRCGPRVQAKTLRWLKHHDFYESTGVNPKRVRFCLERDDKARICHRLRLTHFIDDRLDVLQKLGDVHRILFDPHRSASVPKSSSIRAVRSWEEIGQALLASKS